jgi:hypothetical protein
MELASFGDGAQAVGESQSNAYATWKTRDAGGSAGRRRAVLTRSGAGAHALSCPAFSKEVPLKLVLTLAALALLAAVLPAGAADAARKGVFPYPVPPRRSATGSPWS